MPLKNRIRYWRLETGIQDIMDFAEIIGFSPWILERWEEQKIQPTLEALCQIKERLLPCHPQLTLEDLVDYNKAKE